MAVSIAAGSVSESGLRNSRKSPRACRAARLQAAANPRFSGDTMTVASGHSARTTSTLASAEALSTTMTSKLVAVAALPSARSAAPT